MLYAAPPAFAPAAAPVGKRTTGSSGNNAAGLDDRGLYLWERDEEVGKVRNLDLNRPGGWLSSLRSQKQRRLKRKGCDLITSAFDGSPRRRRQWSTGR